MTVAELRYEVHGLSVTFTGDVLEHFTKYRQRRCYHREAGGQLFAKIREKNWTISAVTGPRRSDLRSRFGFVPDKRIEQDEIYSYHAKGLEYVGDWHTHPQDIPRPSPDDVESIGNVVRQSQHHFPGFLLCIVGRIDFPEGLWLSFHDRAGRAHNAHR